MVIRINSAPSSRRRIAWHYYAQPPYPSSLSARPRPYRTAIPRQNPDPQSAPRWVHQNRSGSDCREFPVVLCTISDRRVGSEHHIYFVYVQRGQIRYSSRQSVKRTILVLSSCRKDITAQKWLHERCQLGHASSPLDLTPRSYKKYWQYCPLSRGELHEEAICPCLFLYQACDRARTTPRVSSFYFSLPFCFYPWICITCRARARIR